MKPWLHKIEIFVDKIIPLLLVILLVIIVGEFAFHEFMLKHSLTIEIIDGFIIFIFILDLIFKYLRIRNIPKFLRASWIDIIAIFPFFIVFRLFEGVLGLLGISETISSAQKIVHVGVEVEKEVSGVIKESELVAKEASRSEKLIRFLRPIARSVRFSKVGNEDVREETEKQAKKVVKETKKGAKVIVKESKFIVNQAEKEAKATIKEAETIVKDVEKVPRHIKAAIFYEKPRIMENVNKKLNKLKKEIKKL